MDVDDQAAHERRLAPAVRGDIEAVEDDVALGVDVELTLARRRVHGVGEVESHVVGAARYREVVVKVAPPAGVVERVFDRVGDLERGDGDGPAGEPFVPRPRATGEVGVRPAPDIDADRGGDRDV